MGDFTLMSRLASRRPKFLGYKLKQIRDRWSGNSLTQEEIARLIKHCLKDDFAEDYPELNREYISGYERGTRTIPPVVLLAYAHIANVFVEVLIDDRLVIDPGLRPPFAEKYGGIWRIDK